MTSWFELWQDTTEDLGGTEAWTAQPVGTETETFLPAFIPIGIDGAGDFLSVDTRGGDRSGCVVEFYKDGGAAFRWDSIAHILDCTATALEEGVHFEGWVPVLENGILRWDYQP